MSLTEAVQKLSYLAYIVSLDHNVFHVFGHAEIMPILHTGCATIQLLQLYFKHIF